MSGNPHLTNYKRWRKADKTVGRAPMDEGLRAIALAVLREANSTCRYELSWPSQTTLAKRANKKVRAKDSSSRTIKRRIELLRRLGVVDVVSMNKTEAREFFRREYGYDLKTCAPLGQNFYRIKYDHPFWAKGKVDGEQVAAIKREQRAGSGRPRSALFRNPIRETACSNAFARFDEADLREYLLDDEPDQGDIEDRVEETLVWLEMREAVRHDDERGEKASRRATCGPGTSGHVWPANGFSSGGTDPNSLPPDETLRRQIPPPTPDESDSSKTVSFVGHHLALHPGSADGDRRRTCPELVSHEESNGGSEFLAASCEGTARARTLRGGCATPPAASPTGSIGVRDSSQEPPPGSEQEEALPGSPVGFSESGKAEEPSETGEAPSGLPKASVGFRPGLAESIRQQLAALAHVPAFVDIDSE